MSVDRDRLGRIVRETWIAYCRETGDTKPSHLASWDDITEWDREVDRRIGEAVACAVTVPPTDSAAEVAADLDALIAALDHVPTTDIVRLCQISNRLKALAARLRGAATRGEDGR